MHRRIILRNSKWNVHKAIYHSDWYRPVVFQAPYLTAPRSFRLPAHSPVWSIDRSKATSPLPNWSYAPPMAPLSTCHSYSKGEEENRKPSRLMLKRMQSPSPLLPRALALRCTRQQCADAYESLTKAALNEIMGRDLESESEDELDDRFWILEDHQRVTREAPCPFTPATTKRKLQLAPRSPSAEGWANWKYIHTSVPDEGSKSERPRSWRLKPTSRIDDNLLPDSHSMPSLRLNLREPSDASVPPLVADVCGRAVHGSPPASTHRVALDAARRRNVRLVDPDRLRAISDIHALLSTADRYQSDRTLSNVSDRPRPKTNVHSSRAVYAQRTTFVSKPHKQPSRGSLRSRANTELPLSNEAVPLRPRSRTALQAVGRRDSSLAAIPPPKPRRRWRVMPSRRAEPIPYTQPPPYNPESSFSKPPPLSRRARLFRYTTRILRPRRRV